MGPGGISVDEKKKDYVSPSSRPLGPSSPLTRCALPSVDSNVWHPKSKRRAFPSPFPTCLVFPIPATPTSLALAFRSRTIAASTSFVVRITSLGSMFAEAYPNIVSSARLRSRCWLVFRTRFGDRSLRHTFSALVPRIDQREKGIFHEFDLGRILSLHELGKVEREKDATNKFEEEEEG